MPIKTYLPQPTRCLKNTENVSFKTLRAKRATFTFGQKLTQNVKNVAFW